MSQNDDDSPARRLGRKLKEARIAAGFRSQQALGDEINLHRTTVAKIESGQRQISAKVLKLWCETCGADFELYEASAKLAWVTDSAPVPVWFADFRRAQLLAHTVRSWNPIIVPGLLQTPDYAQVLYQVTGTPEDAIGELVAARTDLQHQTIRRQPPIMLMAVVDEAVLHRQVGSKETMHAQLMRLAELSSLPNVSIQIVPASRAANAGHLGPFTVASLDDGDVMLLESLEDVMTDTRSSVRAGLGIFDRTRTDALSGPESAELIAKVAEEWTT